MLTPAGISGAMDNLAARLARKAGASTPNVAGAPVPAAENHLEELADRLWEARGRSLVVCGLGDVRAQVLCNFINHLLGNYGNTLDVVAPSYQKQGDDGGLAALIDEIRAGKVSALFLSGPESCRGPAWRRGTREITAQYSAGRGSSAAAE